MSKIQCEFYTSGAGVPEGPFISCGLAREEADSVSYHIYPQMPSDT